MSFIVLAISAAHALPPIIGAATTRSKPGLWTGSTIGVLISLAWGRPAFIIPDLIGVGLGIWIGLSIIDRRPET